jgi:hypothetical protein
MTEKRMQRVQLRFESEPVNCKFRCEIKTACVLQLQSHWYDYCVEIRCQDTTSENGEL